jgi:hypothetical protein
MSDFVIPRESGYECGTFNSSIHFRIEDDGVELIAQLFYIIQYYSI